MARRARKPLPQDPVEVEIESLTHEGRGLAHFDGKAIFVDGALAGERVRFRYTRMQRNYDEGRVVEVLKPSARRVEPRCQHFGVCGGCSLQHLEAGAQIVMKQEVLADVFARIGSVEPEAWLPPLSAGSWGYRRKARLGVRYVPKKGRTLVGFRERGTSFITDLSRCEILHPLIGDKVQRIAEVIDQLGIRERIPQIEVAMGDTPCVLVLRVLDSPSAVDIGLLQALGDDEGFHIYLQEGGVDTILPLPGQAVDLHYSLPAHQVRIDFQPTDFTQVNLELNRSMLDQALGLLNLRPDERVLDLFCGLGNFTLPIARRAGEVVGVEGDESLVQRARDNASANGLTNCEFHSADLYGEMDTAPWMLQRFGKALLDPPRSGAIQVLDLLPRLGVERIVYVSCNPSTLARDADRLVNELGYRLLSAGVMDMFPHTAHVESMALFEKNGDRDA